MNERFKYIEFKHAIAYNICDSGSERERIFDTNSFSIGMNNICSRCISHKVEYSVGPLKECSRFVKVFGGKNNMNIKIGTIKWSWLDSTGSDHDIRIPNNYVIP